MIRSNICRRGHDLLLTENIYITPTGVRQCKICRRAQHTAYRRSPKGWKASKHRDIKEVGWTIERYEAAKREQKNACAICGTPFEKFPKSPFCDHDHILLEPRGLLCSTCNTGLGMFKDDPSLLEKALEYLRKYGK